MYQNKINECHWKLQDVMAHMSQSRGELGNASTEQEHQIAANQYGIELVELLDTMVSMIG